MTQKRDANVLLDRYKERRQAPISVWGNAKNTYMGLGTDEPKVQSNSKPTKNDRVASAISLKHDRRSSAAYGQGSNVREPKMSLRRSFAAFGSQEIIAPPLIYDMSPNVARQSKNNASFVPFRKDPNYPDSIHSSA